MMNWTTLFLLNLIFPVLFGLGMTEGAGRYGMGLVIVMLWLAGLLICWLSTRLTWALLWGSVFTALMQFIPYPLMIVGSYATSFAERFNTPVQGRGMELMNTFVSGWVATLLTGGCMMMIALATGVMMGTIAGYYSPRPHQQLTPDT